jgi:predicted site-specific integrase-resolvase
MTYAPTVAEPVGLSDIADRLGVAHQTAKQWNLRGLLPPPKWTVSGRPAWEWKDVEKWARKTGRLT